MAKRKKKRRAPIAQNSGRNSRSVPPNLRPHCFPPGISGNPGGRPKVRPISDRYRRIAETTLPEKERKRLGLSVGATYGDALAVTLFDGRANPSVAKEIREALEGRATQRIELTGEDGEPVQMEDVRAKLFAKLGQ